MEENKENVNCTCTPATGMCAYHALSMPACTECSRLASRVEELEKLLRRYEPDPDFSQKELIQWYHIRMHEVVNRAYRVYCDTKTVFPKGLARWMGVNTEDDFSKVTSEREVRKKAESECSRLASRVEELEKLARDVKHMIEHGGRNVDFEEWCAVAEQLLAGAHAEEKE